MEKKFIEQKVSRECIEYAIENFSASEATNRIGDYIKGIINIDKMQYETALEIARLEKEASGLCQSVIDCDFTVQELSDIGRYINRDMKETRCNTKRFKYLAKFYKKVVILLKDCEMAYHSR